MPIWDKKDHRKCDYCGKSVVSASVGAISGSTAMIMQQTGATLCGECAFKMIASFVPENDDTPEARVLVTKATGEVAQRTGLPNQAFRVKCHGFLGSDVEISEQSTHYDVKWYKFIRDIEPAVDYVVNWIKENPLPSHVLSTLKDDSEIVQEQSRFALLFVPAGVPAPKQLFIQEFLNYILPMTQFHERSWRIILLPDASASEQRAYMEKNLTDWIAVQRDSARLLFDQKLINFENGDQITCIIAYLRDVMKEVNHMTVDECAICGLEISSLDRSYGRVVEMKNKEVHSWCRVIKMGIVPECPLYNNITPKPCSNECIQARKCANEGTCSCKCDNLVCQIGVSVRELRAKGMMPWQGYIPMKLR